MKRAVELFAFEKRPSASVLVATTWSTTSEPEPDALFMSVAVTNWELVVTRQESGAWVTVRGPETRATPAGIPEAAEFFGITFTLGTFMPDLSPQQLVDSSVTLPLASRNAFWLDGSAWELPGPGNADVFVERLVRAGLLVHDPVAAAALHDVDSVDDVDVVDGLSTRSVERRVARATGLTQGTIRQIRRAEQAVELLSRGVPALDVARRAGYADQSHMSRSLARFVGQTPSQVTASGSSVR
jgi:AraC-like DNA-binding protein